MNGKIVAAGALGIGLISGAAAYSIAQHSNPDFERDYGAAKNKRDAARTELKQRQDDPTLSYNKHVALTKQANMSLPDSPATGLAWTGAGLAGLGAVAFGSDALALGIYTSDFPIWGGGKVSEFPFFLTKVGAPLAAAGVGLLAGWAISDHIRKNDAN